jgi:hypothetical protein
MPRLFSCVFPPIGKCLGRFGNVPAGLGTVPGRMGKIPSSGGIFPQGPRLFPNGRRTVPNGLGSFGEASPKLPETADSLENIAIRQNR